MNVIGSIELENQLQADDIEHSARTLITDGAVLLRGIVPPSLLSRLTADLETATSEDAARFGQAYPFPGMVHALMVRGASFMDLLGLEAIRAISRAVLGVGAIVHAFNSSSLSPHGSNYTGRIHVDSPRHVPGYITNIGFVFPLDEFTAENGAMEIWPGSFRLPAAPSIEEFDAHKMVLSGLRPGDAILFNCRSWHQGGVNSTADPRRAITLNVCRAYMRQQFDFPRMIPAEVKARLSDDVLQFLGYHVRMPATMDEFLAPPEQRTYRPGQE